MWTSRCRKAMSSRLFSGNTASSSCYPRCLLSSKTIIVTGTLMGKKKIRPLPASLATVIFLGTTTATIGFCSSFPFSGANSSNCNARSAPHVNDGGQHFLRSLFNGNQQYLVPTSASNTALCETLSSIQHIPPKETRSYTTKADQYFQKWRRLPLPPIAHDNLQRLIHEENSSEDTISTITTNKDSNCSNRILVIGDVHGCIDELKSLVQTATKDFNHDKQFAAIVLVGDLCNKGPSSAQVIQYVRDQCNWFCVRGNHDNSALSAALGDEERSMKARYQWVNELTDDDVTWMSNLPYTITIPKTMLNGDVASNDHHTAQDVIIVHAGIDPAIALENQDPTTMITVRNLQVEGKGSAWAKLWRGPELIIFGHDAKRGLQYEQYAIGLDSGCVYGKKLTGIILPERTLVSVDAKREHCPIKKKA